MKILVIQPAFLGDTILTTSVLEKLHHTYPAAKIDYLVRKGHEDLFKDHPYLHELLVWDKSRNKTGNLFRMISKIRQGKYDYVINTHRHMSSGLMTAFSGAQQTLGFEDNPLSFLFSKRFPHALGNGKHEIERNQELIREITDDHVAKPRLYPSKADYASIEKYKSTGTAGPYLVLAPASVWFTKQFPAEKWIEWINACHDKKIKIFLLGAKIDKVLCDKIKAACPETDITNLSGNLTMLESAALMAGALMNYANDSAPMHFASAMNAPVTAIYTSTIPKFGFGPLSDIRFVVETKEALKCRPCGVHGLSACPEKHFKCALGIRKEDIPLVHS
jgi:ADP-heptose:LPS heptosyltransferase